MRVTRIGWPATGTSRSTNETVKFPTFRFSRTTTTTVARAVRPPLSVALQPDLVEPVQQQRRIELAEDGVRGRRRARGEGRPVAFAPQPVLQLPQRRGRCS